MRAHGALFLAGALFWSTSLLACSLLSAGGETAAARYTYLSGWVKRDYSVSLDKAYQACLAATQSMGLEIVSQKKKAAAAELSAQSSDQDYWINLDSQEGLSTTVSVRVGYRGDMEAAMAIHKAIEQRLNG